MTVQYWLPGAKVVKANRDGGSMVGGAQKVVWHTTENDPNHTTAEAVANYLNGTGNQVHLVWNPVTGETVQMLPANLAGRGLVHSSDPQTNRGGTYVVQIEVVGHASDPFTSGPCVGLQKIQAWLEQLGVPHFWAGTEDRSVANWAKAGHFGHMDVPENYHTDPGKVDKAKLIACSGVHTVATPPAHTSVTPVPHPVAPAKNPALVKAIQSDLHLTADGKWGPATEVAAHAVVADVRSDIKYLQTRVGATADGVWGPKSEAARIETIKKLQAAIGATPDGVWGAKSAAAWLAAYNANYMKF